MCHKCVRFGPIQGEKCMLVDDSLLRQLDRAFSMKILQAYNVRKVFKIKHLPPEASYSRLVYVIPPSRKSVLTIIKHAEVDNRSNITRNKLILFVPKQTPAIRYLLESHGVLNSNTALMDVCFGWNVLDSDLLCLDVSEVFTSYFLRSDTSWAYFFGRQLKDLLTSLSLSPKQLTVLGTAAEISAAGLNNAFSSSPISNLSVGSTVMPLPSIYLFSRDLDYVTPFLVPMTFEALIHEVIGIENGVVLLPNISPDDCINPKLILNSLQMPIYKDVRDAHISTVHAWLKTRKNLLEDSRTGLDFSMVALSGNIGQKRCNSSLDMQGSSTFSDVHSQLGPILAARRDLTSLFICFDEVMKRMTQEERVEDLISAQTAILQSGSGNALASTQSDSFSFSLPKTSNSDAPASSSATGTCADDLQSQPLRLSIEWLSTRQGDRIVEAIRGICLLSVSHDGLVDEVYWRLHSQLLQCAGFCLLPVLSALRRARILAPRSDFAALNPAKEASRAALLIRGRKSLYNRLHAALHLSVPAQAGLQCDQSPISPSYVFHGQHQPVVVRLVESLWFQNISSNGSTRTNFLASAEIVSPPELNNALTLLGINLKGLNSPLMSSRPDEPSRTSSHGQTIVVVFVGGCTYAEVSALRFAAQRRCWHLLIVTSQMLSTKSIIQQVCKAAL